MKKFLLNVICLIITSFAISVQAEQPLDQIVAVVNDDVITRSELDHALSLINSQMNPENVPNLTKKVLERQVLDQLINKKLQLQLAKTAGIKITPKMIDEAIANIAKQNNISVATLYKQLSREGVSAKDYREEIHDQMAIQKLQQNEVIVRLNVTPAEIDHFLQSKPWKQAEPKEYRLKDILIPLDDHPSAVAVAQAKKQAAVIMVDLRKNKSIDTIKKDYPALQASDLGWRKLNDMPSAFVPFVAKLGTNDVTDPIQTSNGIHLVKIEGVNTLGGAADYAPTRQQAEQLILQRKFNDAAQTWVSKMRSQAFIEIKLPKSE